MSLFYDSKGRELRPRDFIGAEIVSICYNDSKGAVYGKIRLSDGEIVISSTICNCALILEQMLSK